MSDPTIQQQSRNISSRAPGSVRIAAVVVNSVSHDARVLKEADSLAAAGYDVAIFGIRDNRADEPLTVRESGAVIHRVDWKPLAHVRVAYATLIAGALLTLAAIASYLIFRQQILVVLTSRLLVDIVCMGGLAAIGAAFVMAGRRQFALAQRLAGGATPAADPTPAWRWLNWLNHLAARIALRVKGWFMRRTMHTQLLQHVMEHQPDVVHCHDLNALPIGHRYKRRTGRLVVYDSHELYEELSQSTWRHKRKHRRLQRVCSASVDRFITINDSIARTLNERYPRLPRACIIKNATRAPEGQIIDDGRLHRAAGFERSIRILLYQGGFALHRGLEALVSGGALLPGNWRLVMMGWGRLEPTLREIARTVDPTGERIRFLPAAPHHELAEWTAGATLGVIPYENVCLNHWFCTPNKLWEYPVAGVPFLASPFPEISQVVNTHGVGVLLSDPASPENIAQTVASVTDADIERMKCNCRNYILVDNWSMYERRLIELYDHMLGVRRPAVKASEAGTTALANQASRPDIVITSSGLQSVAP